MKKYTVKTFFGNERTFKLDVNFYKRVRDMLHKKGMIRKNSSIKTLAGKTKITKMFKVLQKFNNCMPIKITKTKKESVKNYKQRVRRIKNNFGQLEHNKILPFIFLTVNKFYGDSCKFKRAEMYSGIQPNHIGDYKDRWVPVNAQEFALDEKGYISTFLKVYEPDILLFGIGTGIKKGFGYGLFMEDGEDDNEAHDQVVDHIENNFVKEFYNYSKVKEAGVTLSDAVHHFIVRDYVKNKRK